MEPAMRWKAISRSVGTCNLESFTAWSFLKFVYWRTCSLVRPERMARSTPFPHLEQRATCNWNGCQDASWTLENFSTTGSRLWKIPHSNVNPFRRLEVLIVLVPVHVAVHVWCWENPRGIHQAHLSRSLQLRKVMRNHVDKTWKKGIISVNTSLCWTSKQITHTVCVG